MLDELADQEASSAGSTETESWCGVGMVISMVWIMSVGKIKSCMCSEHSCVLQLVRPTHCLEAELVWVSSVLSPDLYDGYYAIAGCQLSSWGDVWCQLETRSRKGYPGFHRPPLSHDIITSSFLLIQPLPTNQHFVNKGVQGLMDSFIFVIPLPPRRVTP